MRKKEKGGKERERKVILINRSLNILINGLDFLLKDINS